MKKFIILIAIFACTLSGCSSKKEIKKNEEELYFLFAIPLNAHPVWQEAQKGFETACNDFNIHCNTIGPGSIDVNAMNNIVKTAIIQKAHGIITQGVIDPSLIEMANKIHLPIVLVDSDMKNTKRYAYMGKDFHEQALLLLDKIQEKYGKHTKLNVSVQVADFSFDIAKQQIKELEKTLSDHPGGYEIVNISESKSDQVRAKQEWAKVFSTYDDINVAINFAGESAESCFKIAEELNIREKMLIFGVDDVSNTINLIKDGSIDGSIVTSFFNYGYNSVQVLNDYYKGNQLSKSIIPAKIILVDKNNVNTYKEDLIL